MTNSPEKYSLFIDRTDYAEGLTTLSVAPYLSGEQVRELNQYKVEHPEAGVNFYHPPFGGANGLHHAVITYCNRDKQTVFGFRDNELAKHPRAFDARNRIPVEQYGLWRVVKQLDSYLHWRYQREVEVVSNC